MKKENIIRTTIVMAFIAFLVFYSLIYFSKDSLIDYINQLEKNKPVSVFVIDTGFNVKEINSTRLQDGYNAIDNSSDISDNDGHGTTITELIYENTNDNVSITPVKVAEKDGETSIDNVCKGLRYAIEHHADVINLSMNTIVYSSDAGELRELFNEIKEKKIDIVVSAGNTTSDVKHLCPANIKSAIVVSSANENLTAYPFSNFGRTVDYSCYARYNNTYGTSVSCAYVTSLTADLRSAGIENPEKVLNRYSCKLNSNKNYGKYLDIKDMKHGDKENTGGERLYAGNSPESAYNIKSNLFDLNWRYTNSNKLNHYLSDTEPEYIGAFLSSLPDKDIEEIKEKCDVLNTDVEISRLTYSEKELSYIDYCIEKYKEKHDILKLS